MRRYVADEAFPACSTNDTLLAALYLMNHHLINFMVAIACENKINEIKATRQTLIKNAKEKEILDILAKWMTSYDPKRWDHHTVNFPSVCSAFRAQMDRF